MKRRDPNWLLRTLMTLGLMLLYAGAAHAAAVVAPTSITVPANNASGTYSVRWGASTTPDVTYLLQEATNDTFTTGVRVVYTGTALGVAIDTNRAPGKTCYYRVRAKKGGFTDSPWRTGVNGCKILVPAQAPASITVPAADDNGAFTVSWGASSTPSSRYILQEATDDTFTTNLRVAYDGTGLSTQILRPTGYTYFYRVKALKRFLAGSPWTVDQEGCTVGTVTGQPIAIDTINLSVTADPTILTMTFSVAYVASGAPVVGLTMDNFRIYMSELVPGAAATDPSYWRRWLYERNSNPGTLTDNGDGTYTYVFLTPITAPVPAPDPANVQRLSLRVSGSNTSGLNSTQIGRTNGFHDFMLADPATAVASPRDIVLTAACNSCHGRNIGNVGHGGGYTDTRMCVNCHSPLYADADMVALKVDFTTMIHQIHSAINATDLVPPGEFDWSEVTYPQDILNCAKCHQGTDGDNWKNKPSRLACGSCHTSVNFATGENHVGGAWDNDAFCLGCHTASDVSGYHTTTNKTPNNPATPAGAVEFTYHIYGVTVNENNQAVVDFAIKKNGRNLSLAAAPAGYSGGPSFLLAYALPQDGIATPADYNNLGKNSAQPDSVSVTSLIGTADLVEKSPGTRRYLATLSTKPFPVGATMRAVALQGYFTQSAGTNGIAESTARHAESVMRPVTGDAVRRAVVDQAKCLQCHEILEGHGGNRVNNPQVCVFCHVPNLSSSGRTMNLTGYVIGANENTDLAITMFGPDASLWPEDSNNFKDMIHGIHGGAQRTTPYEFVRVRSGNAYPFDWSEVTFPGNPALCTTCHKAGTYTLPLANNLLNSTIQVAVDGTLPADVTTARLGANLPGGANTITSPTAAACVFCHNSDTAVAHMDSLTGSINIPRSEGAGAETCATCHGPNKWMDVKLVHGL